MRPVQAVRTALWLEAVVPAEMEKLLVFWTIFWVSLRYI